MQIVRYIVRYYDPYEHQDDHYELLQDAHASDCERGTCLSDQRGLSNPPVIGHRQPHHHYAGRSWLSGSCWKHQFAENSCWACITTLVLIFWKGGCYLHLSLLPQQRWKYYRKAEGWQRCWHCVVNILTLRMIDVTKQRSFLFLMLLWAFMLKAPHVPRLFEANIC